MKSDFPLGIITPLAAEGWALVGPSGWNRIDGRLCRPDRLADGTGVWVVCGGHGPERTTEAARWLVARGVTALAIMGVGGGLHPRLRSGDLVWGEEILAEEDESGSERSKIERTGGDFWHGPLISTRRPVLTAADKASLFQKTGALAIDLESAAASHAARQAGIPFFALRAICDPADREVPAELAGVLGPAGNVCLLTLVRTLAGRPMLLKDMLWLQRDFSTARKSLARDWRKAAAQFLKSAPERSHQGCSTPLAGPPASPGADPQAPSRA